VNFISNCSVFIFSRFSTIYRLSFRPCSFFSLSPFLPDKKGCSLRVYTAVISNRPTDCLRKGSSGREYGSYVLIKCQYTSSFEPVSIRSSKIHARLYCSFFKDYM
jgi:hypothetical protein